MSNPVQDVQRLGQSIWYDNIRRGLLDSGELKRLIEMGVTGLTSNPTIFEKAIAGSTDYDDALTELARSDRSVDDSYEALVIEDIRNTADLLRPIYERTGGVDGYASLEVSPKLAHDTAGTTAEARRLFGALDKPNVMIKVPATAEGIPRRSPAYKRGHQHQRYPHLLAGSLPAGDGGLHRWTGRVHRRRRRPLPHSLRGPSFFVSRVDTAVDALLEERIRQGEPDVKALMGKAAIANAKLAYREFQQVFGEERFSSLKDQQARPQRPLWASTSTKNPRLQRPHVRGGSDRPRHGGHRAARYADGASGVRQARTHPGERNGRGGRAPGSAGKGGHQYGPGYRHAPSRWSEIVRRLLRQASGQHQREDGQAYRPAAPTSKLLSWRPPAGT